MDLSKLLSFASEFEKAAKAPKMWKKKPHGWKEKSVKQYSKTMTKGEEHPFTECVEKMKGKVDNPEAFCASVKDIAKGTTGWRGGDKKKKSERLSALKKLAIGLGEGEQKPFLDEWIMSGYSPYLAPEMRDKKVTGKVYNDPRFDDGATITIRPKTYDPGSRTVTTSRSAYTLGTPDPDWVVWMEEEAGGWNPDNPFLLSTEQPEAETSEEIPE